MDNTNNILKLEKEIVDVLKNIYDPEIPLNIYDLGLIYNIGIENNNSVIITMTLTAPNCPVADSLVEEVRQSIANLGGVARADVNLVFDPPWDQSMLSEEAMLELGML